MPLQTYVNLSKPNAAMRRVKVGTVSHFVFDYRERARTALTSDGLAAPTMDKRAVEFLSARMALQPAIPADLQMAAERHAERLTAILRAFSPVMRRHQSHGALDSSKLARLARPGLSEREFDFEAGRAYKRRVSETRVRQIKIAIVGDFNFNARQHNPSYAPTLAKLIHVLSHACTLAGIPCAAYGTRGHLGLRHQRRDTVTGRDVGLHWDAPSAEHSATAILKDYGDEMNGATFALLTNEGAFSTAYASTEMGHGSASGNGGIDFAREHGADFVVAVGKFPNSAEAARADVLEPASVALDTLIDRVCAALERRQQEGE